VVWRCTCGNFYRISFQDFIDKLSFYKEFSQYDRTSFAEGLKKISNKSVDLIHIDGFHTYQAVSDDFAASLKKLSDIGTMLLHDINEFQDGFGVYKFWMELTAKYRTI